MKSAANERPVSTITAPSNCSACAPCSAQLAAARGGYHARANHAKCKPDFKPEQDLVDGQRLERENKFGEDALELQASGTKAPLQALPDIKAFAPDVVLAE